MAQGDNLSEQQSVEITGTPYGSLKIFGADLNTFITILSFIMLTVFAWVLWTHSADAMENRKDAKETGKAVAQELKEANNEVANVLR